MTSRTGFVRLVAVADSDSYLKWAAATLASLDDVAAGIVLLRNPIQPSPAQVGAALAGTPFRPDDVASVHVARLRAHLRRAAPDVVLVAATGPVVELVVRAVAGLRPRPAVVTGLPGMALPATSLGVRYRAASDAFVVHSHTEREAYEAAFATQGLHPVLALERLPFVPVGPGPAAAPAPEPGAAPPVERVVFAAQAKVPATRADRLCVLDALARAGRDRDVVVKLRAVGGERQTHAEEHPYPALWEAERAARGWSDEVRFVAGPLGDWLGPGAGLVTVSSTAALEAVAAGVPVAVVEDFGVDDSMLTGVFAGSGLLRPLDAVVRGDLGLPDPVWWARNYGHDDPGELGHVVAGLARAVRTGRLDPRPVRPRSWRRYVRSWLRCAVPLVVVRPGGPRGHGGRRPGGSPPPSTGA
ncbi:DUF6716 putative glycosyltransferase [Cellulosimicrobium marinum]|uniref:DUF6716 putative glycosyltransferase n=1 Tax=Cellulosimicrobium marinum TaxID=1638992 RepID=UPI001E4C8660|nr:DUF6716 putative glycosyltransferase [Cellulosimicrobium marinum]MCB7136461.1 hypothetical protein [Cellulosimicrobium marinum]